MSEWSYIAELMEWDWVYTTTPGGLRLHHVAAIDDAEGFEAEMRGTVATTCGMRREVRIPGLIDRMGTDRCARCCDRLGVQRGVGSPKNDPALRAWVRERLATQPA